MCSSDLIMYDVMRLPSATRSLLYSNALLGHAGGTGSGIEQKEFIACQRSSRGSLLGGCFSSAELLASSEFALYGQVVGNGLSACAQPGHQVCHHQALVDGPAQPGPGPWPPGPGPAPPTTGPPPTPPRPHPPPPRCSGCRTT